ncbi:tumor necrosis factor receptor superfamily member 4 [Sphaerodactylus townsendi]|uniref:Uncharacterized protein n=1 Tax=Sphaerodactylus townsendi TaxID=933632 RepID=A0ACB8EE92_9SAUR|nr:tumor necrosis factor receptor superfamily member 4 [Sphaerodactylus townsendi]
MTYRLNFSMFLLFSLVLRSSGLSCGPQEYPLDGLKCCHLCAPGTTMQARCTRNTDTICRPCDEGSYNPTFTTWDCKSCTICDPANGLQWVKKCERTSDTVCVCLPGHEPATSGFGEKRCNPCPKGHFSKGGEKACTPWTNCTATGRTVFRAGSREEDAICNNAPTLTTKLPIKSSSKREMGQATSVTKPNSTSSTSIPLPTEGPSGGVQNSEYLLYILVATALLLASGVIILLKIFGKTKEPGRFAEQIYKDGKNSFRIPIQEEQIDTKASLVRN